MTTPLQFLREAVTAVPAIKYALGIGGIVATISIIYSFKIDPRVAVVGTIVMLVLMGVLVVFARMSASASNDLASPTLVFTWFTLLLFIAVSLSLFTSVFYQKPLDLAYWLDPSRTPNNTAGADAAKSHTKPESAAEELNTTSTKKQQAFALSTYKDVYAFAYAAGGMSLSPTDATAFAETWTAKCADESFERFKETYLFAYSAAGMNMGPTTAKEWAMKKTRCLNK